MGKSLNFKQVILDNTAFLVKEENLKVSLLEFFNSSIFEDTLLAYCTKEFRKSVENFINYFADKSYNDLGWEFLCNSMYSFRTTDNYEYSKSHVRKIIENYFLYLLQEERFPSPNLETLKKHKNLVQKGFYTKVAQLPDILPNSIQMQYPINTQPNYMFQYLYKGSNCSNTCNINLNTGNNFLYNILVQFITQLSNESVGKPVSIPYRLFFYYFETSFGTRNTPQNERDFTYATFKNQYSFFKKKEYIIQDYINQSLCRNLINFYIFLDSYIKSIEINHNIFKDTWLNASIMSNSLFQYYYDNGYEYVIYNPLEDYPKCDKWLINAGEQSNNSVAVRNIGNCSFDLTPIKDEDIRDDIKCWVWNSDGLINVRTKAILYIIDFFIFKSDFVSGKIKSFRPNEKKSFSFEFMWLYMVYLDDKFDNHNTKRGITIQLRNFLLYYKEKYKIDQKALDILKMESIKSEGTPITKKDINILLEDFRVLKEKHKDGQLLYYVFILCVTTNMRIGEVVNLERNCIVYQDINGNGTIRLKKKTSKGEYLHREYNAETLQIIRKALDITEECVEYAENKLQHYVFIMKRGNTQNVTRLSGEFNRQFYKIVRTNQNKLDKLYRPYDLRHTFINSIYDDGIKNNVSIEKMQSITDNTYNTVMNHYRRKLELVDYVEIMSKVVISNVDIDGNILVEEEEIVNNHPVMKNLGGCGENDCINVKTHLCLTCNHFFTCLSRIPIFEQRVLFFRDKLDNVKSNDPIKVEYETYLKLYATYLSKMLDLKSKMERKNI